MLTEEEVQALRIELESVKAEKETLAGELDTKATAITEVEQTLATKDRRNRYPEAGGG